MPRKKSHVKPYYRKRHGTSLTGGMVSEHDRWYETNIRTVLRQTAEGSADIGMLLDKEDPERAKMLDEFVEEGVKEIMEIEPLEETPADKGEKALSEDIERQLERDEEREFIKSAEEAGKIPIAAWVHPEYGGDDYEILITVPKGYSEEQIRKAVADKLAAEFSSVLDDWQYL